MRTKCAREKQGQIWNQHKKFIGKSLFVSLIKNLSENLLTSVISDG